MPEDRDDLESFLPPRHEEVPPPPPPPPPPPEPFYGAPDDYPPRKGKAKRGRSLAWYEVWIQALTQPYVETYEALLADPLASANRAYLWVFAVALLGSLLDAATGSNATAGLRDASSNVNFSSVTLVICAPFGAAIGVLFFALFAGFQNFVAHVLGGAGTYEGTVYANASYYAPIALVSSVLGTIPVLGCFSGLLGLYGLVLNVIALRAVHQFSLGQAILTVLAPVLLFGLCIAAALFAFFSTAIS